MIFFLSIFILFGGILQDRPQGREEFNIHIIHPGISSTDPVECTLIGLKDKSWHFTGYSMNVQSVVCGKSQCKVVPVHIFWQRLGDYDHFELDPGIVLEKEKGKPYEGRLQKTAADPFRSSFSLCSGEPRSDCRIP